MPGKTPHSLSLSLSLSLMSLSVCLCLWSDTVPILLNPFTDLEVTSRLDPRWLTRSGCPPQWWPSPCWTCSGRPGRRLSPTQWTESGSHGPYGTGWTTCPHSLVTWCWSTLSGRELWSWSLWSLWSLWSFLVMRSRYGRCGRLIDDLRKSRELHSVSAYRHGLYIYRSMPAGVAQSNHAFVGGTVSTWARWRIPINKRQKRHQKCRSNTHCSRGTCRSDSRFPIW